MYAAVMNIYSLLLYALKKLIDLFPKYYIDFKYISALALLGKKNIATDAGYYFLIIKT